MSTGVAVLLALAVGGVMGAVCRDAARELLDQVADGFAELLDRADDWLEDRRRPRKHRRPKA